MLTLVIGLLVLLAAPIFAANVELTSSLEETNRTFPCVGERVTFTCEVFGSFSLEWRSPLFQPSISYNAIFDSPGRIFTRDSSEANLTFLSPAGGNSNITSTLTIIVPTTEDVSVQCFSTQDNDTMTLTLSAVPGIPQRLQVGSFVVISQVIAIWTAPENSEEYDLSNYTVTVNSSSLDLDETQQVSGTFLTLNVSMTRGVSFTVTVRANNTCGMAGDAATFQLDVPSSSPASMRAVCGLGCIIGIVVWGCVLVLAIGM